MQIRRTIYTPFPGVGPKSESKNSKSTVILPPKDVSTCKQEAHILILALSDTLSSSDRDRALHVLMTGFVKLAELNKCVAIQVAATGISNPVMTSDDLGFYEMRWPGDKTRQVFY